MDITKELADNQTMLLLVSSTDYNRAIADMAKQLSSKSVCYVTLNKTYDALKEAFQKKKINTKNIIFIDAISKTIKAVPAKTDDCFFCSSPGSLTELSLAISKFLKQGFDYLIFDSLTNLMIYEKRSPIAMFVSNIVNKVKATKTKSIFYALKVDQHQELIQETSMFVDKVVDLG
jgi:KaiC/GvpD/RAD55 family RecA-like ATPase